MGQSHSRRSFRPTFEALEDRMLMSVNLMMAKPSGVLTQIIAQPRDVISVQADFTRIAGNFVEQGKAVVSTASGLNLSTETGRAKNDVRIEAQVSLAAAGHSSADLVARYSGPGDTNMYLARLVRFTDSRGTQLQIVRSVNGNDRNLATVNLLTSTMSGRLRFEVIGSSLRLYFNDQLMLTAIDNQIQRGVSGIRAWNPGVLIDGFSATEAD